MRFILDLHHTPDGIHGQVIRDEPGQSESFNGWLELLRLLEPAPAGEGGDPALAVRLLVQAENNRDRETADGLLSAQFVGITRAKGSEQGRQELLMEIADPAKPAVHHRLDKIWSRQASDLGVVRSIVTTDAPFRNTHILIHEDGTWRCLAWHVTRLEP